LRRYILSIFIIVAPFFGLAQEVDSVKQKSDSAINSLIRIDSTQSLMDSTKGILSDSTVANLTDSTNTKATDSVKTKKKGDIATTVNYSAKDSMNFNMKTQDIIMFKKAHVDYVDIYLDADKIKVNYNTKILALRIITNNHTL
jgi:ABC-type Na+ efflux pump permease subunit